MGRPHIVVINGSGGSGKDTFIKLCSKYVKVENKSSIDLIKEAATIVGWRGGKTEKDRLFLSNLKKLSIQYNDAPFNYCVKCIESTKAEVLFLHIREPEEINKIVNYCAVEGYGCTTLLVVNLRVRHIKSNSSDGGVLNYEYHTIIINDSTLLSLELKARDFILELNRERMS